MSVLATQYPQDLAAHHRGADFAERRAARLLRMRFKAMHFVTLGPDHSHRRTLLAQVVSSTAGKEGDSNYSCHPAQQETQSAN